MPLTISKSSRIVKILDKNNKEHEYIIYNLDELRKIREDNNLNLENVILTFISMVTSNNFSFLRKEDLEKIKVEMLERDNNARTIAAK